MPMPKKEDYQKRLNKVRIGLTDAEFQKYQSAKNRLLNSSPPLKSLDILRKCVFQIEDLALLEFLDLPSNDPIKVKLQNDYLFNHIANDKD